MERLDESQKVDSRLYNPPISGTKHIISANDFCYLHTTLLAPFLPDHEGSGFIFLFRSSQRHEYE